ncbi:glycosyltransferase [Desulfospira joergensenii]|uniref:glycosyltransferase n=1 Tax=Desulfospira joergensenii TaxID=53329 RepID=UPI0003B44730|nr:glycosyltransferase [Desulfospira joergensenii]
MKILTLSSVFPNLQQPFLGLFIKERMKHVARNEMVRVVAPVPFSPIDPIARRFKKEFRPAKPCYGLIEPEFKIDHPPFLCFPGTFKPADSVLYFVSLYPFLKKFRRSYDFNLIDAHFAFPDGVAAALLAQAFKVPFTITLRGTELPYSKILSRRFQMKWALQKASQVISVSNSLGKVAQKLGAGSDKIRVIPNGVDTDKFSPVGKLKARSVLMLPEKARILLSVGGLVPRKGFHRVIRILPEIIKKFGNVIYLVVGGASVEGDYSIELKNKVFEKSLEDNVRFIGAVDPGRLSEYYSAADLFVLPTSNEGWANVFMESLACGTPVISTDVGGNREVIYKDELGTIVPFGDDERFCQAVIYGLEKDWDKNLLISHARKRNWNHVSDEVISVFNECLARSKERCAV